jgi:ligand-binding sensor domain-containing protein
MFVCADNGVGYFVEQTDFKMINTDTFNSSIDHVLMDYQGNLWFTSSRLGVLRLCKSVFTLLQTGAIQENQVVNSVMKWQNRFYIGTDSGLEVMDEETGEEYTDDVTETLAGTRIRCIRTDS